MIETFLQWMPGVYNNKTQAFSNPFELPIVRFNVEFLGFNSENGLYSFRVEQYKPSLGDVPYRVGHFTAKRCKDNSIFLQNYNVKDTDEQINMFMSGEAEPYENSNLRINFDFDKEIFESKVKNYTLKKDQRLLNVQSYIKLSSDTLYVLDRAYDASTDKLAWGFDHGAVLLKKESF